MLLVLTCFRTGIGLAAPPPQWFVSMCHSLVTYLRVIHGSPHDMDV